MKFGQLIEYNMRKNFIKNHTLNVVKKLFPDPFLKIQNWAQFWINSLKFHTVSYRPLAFNLYNAVLKKQKEVCN